MLLKTKKHLCEEDLSCIEGLIEGLAHLFTSVESDEFANACKLAAQEMPRSLRALFNDFCNHRLDEGFLLIEGFPIDDEAIGPTPSHWDGAWENPRILREEIFQCLVSSCLGEIFGWLTQENGRYLRNIVPIEAEKNEQLGGSSDVLLLWHVEEAFHPQRADLMSIMCYRNAECACTNVCSTADLNIPPDYWDVLTQPRFFILPDKSHFPENNQSQHWKLSDHHFKKIKAFLAKPECVPALDGVYGKETLRIDEAFMEALPGDEEARVALEWLYQHMTERKTSIIMKPGDLLLIDNRKTAHGRSPYKPNYGPKARWLRRVNITTDLVKSYQWKDKAGGRVIF